MTKKIEDFKEELLTLLEKYGFSISHEDTHGGFQLVDFNVDDNDWLLDFSDRTTKEELMKE